MYKQWLEYKSDPENIKEAETERKDYYNKYDVEDHLLKLFYDHHKWNGVLKHTNFEISTCVLVDFPFSEQAEIINKFVAFPFRYAFGVDFEIVKLIYLMWPKYMKENTGYTKKFTGYDKMIYENLYTIKEKLKAMKNVTRATQYKTGEAYMNWHILGFLPLLGEKYIDLTCNICKLYYDDAQDMLMFGLYHYDPKIFYSDLKKILLYWFANRNITFEGGTGMLGQFDEIIKKYKKHDIDIVNDRDLRQIMDYLRAVEWLD